MCRRCYRNSRNRQIAYGRWDPREIVPAAEVRGHIGRVTAAGVRLTQLAQLAGVDYMTAWRAARDGEARMDAEAAAAILAVPVPERAADIVADNALVPSHGAQRRIQALIAFGYPRNQLARELGMRSNSGAMENLVGRAHGENRGQSITAERERAVKDLFDRLQMIPGPSERARARGRRNGWALPFEWDEAALDDPHGTPQRARWTQGSATRERREQVTDLTERGLSSEQIAERLHTTTRTVERDRALTKTQPSQPVSAEIEAMGALVVQARQTIAARRHSSRASAQRRERTR
ncbi:hypothetical protein ACFYOW_21540 [Nocardia sp. NPDC006982]